MPIYCRACAECKHEAESLESIHNPDITVCPECGRETFEKKPVSSSFVVTGSCYENGYS